jgi:hypothetical protein
MNNFMSDPYFWSMEGIVRTLPRLKIGSSLGAMLTAYNEKIIRSDAGTNRRFHRGFVLQVSWA